MSKIKSFFVDESGQAMTEYALIIALVAVALIGVLVTFKGDIQAVFTKASGTLNPAP